MLLADLASQASIRHAAEQVKRTHQRLQVLVNNAGGYWATRHRTPDGLEPTFAPNHPASFLLTNLLDPLAAGTPARIVNLTSSAQAYGRLHLDDLQFQRRYRVRRPTTSPSSPTCCSPTSSPAAWTAPG